MKDENVGNDCPHMSKKARLAASDICTGQHSPRGWGNTHPFGGSCKDAGPLTVLRTPVSHHFFLANRILSLQRPLLVLALLKVSILRGGATERIPFVECLLSLAEIWLGRVRPVF